MVLIIGLFMAGYSVKKDLSLNMILYSNGYSCFSQTLSEYFSFLVVPLIAVFVIFSLGSPAMSRIIEFSGYSFLDYIFLAIKIIPAILLLTSMQFLIYELNNNLISATLMQFIISIVFSYTAGCFYPKNFFPEIMQRISSILPVDIAFSYILSVFVGSEKSFGNAVVSLMMSLAFLTITAVVRRFKLRSCI